MCTRAQSNTYKALQCAFDLKAFRRLNCESLRWFWWILAIFFAPVLDCVQILIEPSRKLSRSQFKWPTTFSIQIRFNRQSKHKPYVRAHESCAFSGVQVKVSIVFWRSRFGQEIEFRFAWSLVWRYFWRHTYRTLVIEMSAFCLFPCWFTYHKKKECHWFEQSQGEAFLFDEWYSPKTSRNWLSTLYVFERFEARPSQGVH